MNDDGQDGSVAGAMTSYGFGDAAMSMVTHPGTVKGEPGTKEYSIGEMGPSLSLKTGNVSFSIVVPSTWNEYDVWRVISGAGT